MNCCSNNSKKQTIQTLSDSNTECNSGLDTSLSSQQTSLEVTYDNKNKALDEKVHTPSYETSTSKTRPVVQKMTYRVYGMDCPSCAATIEKGLDRLPYIIESKINYNTEKLQISMENNYSNEEIEKLIKQLGFTYERIDKNQKINTYDLYGMDCSSCAKSIERHLIQVQGIQDVEVNFAAGNMKVTHTISVDHIIKEVAKIGFKASLQQKDNEDSATHNNHKELIKIIISGIMISVGFINSYIDSPQLFTITSFAIAMLISGLQPLKSAFYALKNYSLDMNVLMSSAAIGAAIIGEWFEGATVVWLFSLGIYLQNRSMNQTRKSIRNLMNMAPKMAWVQLEKELIEKPVEDINIGDVILIKPGEKIPLDGKIIKGNSFVNEAAITGESLPVNKTVGDTVYAGTMNDNGSLTVKITTLVEDTTLAKIIHLVEEAQAEKAPSEAFIDRFASVYTPIVFCLALFIIIIPPLFGFGLWSEWFYKGLTLIVVACPCALVISTPVAIVAAIGNAANNGVLIKGGTFLETAGKINAIAFDKTGTLTEGKPKVTHLYPITVSENELLSIAYTIENHSTHPIAKSIVSYAEKRNISEKEGLHFKNIVGKGVEAVIEGKNYYVGNRQLFEAMDISLLAVEKLVHKMEMQGTTIVIIGSKDEILGVIGVTDTLRASTKETVNRLHKLGLEELIMLTGDNEGTAKSIAEQATIDHYFSELLPEEKVTILKELQDENYKIAMVGDGINDAPALASADLGVAMGGTGTDTAMETADMVLMADNIDKLPSTIELSRRTLTIIKQNIWFSLIIKFIALALIFPGWLTLWMAVLSDTGAALIVILNALRLLKPTVN